MSRPTALLLSTYPIRVPRHGGQIRLAAVAETFRAAGYEVRSIAVYEPEHYKPKELGPHDLDFPAESEHRLWHGQKGWYLNDLLAGLYAASDEGFSRLLERVPEHVDVIHVEQPWLWHAAARLKTTLKAKDSFLVYGSANIEAPLKRAVFEAMAHRDERALLEIADLERQACAEADLTLAVTEADLDTLKGFGAERTLLARNGISAWSSSEEKLAEWRDKLPKEPFVFYVASAHPPNFTGIEDCLGDSLACIPPTSKLVVAGGVGPHIEHRLNASRWHQINQSRLQILGVLSDRDLAAVKTLAHAYLLPIQDGGGSNIKTAEALYSGKHVIGTTTSFRGFEAFLGEPRVHVADTRDAFREAIRHALDLPEPDPATLDARTDRRALLWSECLAPIPETIARLRGARKVLNENLA